MNDLLEALRFLHVFTACWSVTPDILTIAFSGRAGFHITIPSTLLGDLASPQMTLAYRAWASTLKDSLGLITLDAPSRHPREWWYPQITQVIGHLPPALQDRDAFALALRRASIYSRRRMIRRENSRHPGSDLYKIRLRFIELSQGLPIIWALAKRPRVLPTQPAPQPHPGLVAHLQGFLAEVMLQEAQATAVQKTNGDNPDDSTLAIPSDAQAPLCIQRLLEKQAPLGGSNKPLMTLAAYWRAKGIDVDVAVQLARQWLLYGVSDLTIRSERADSARTAEPHRPHDQARQRADDRLA